MQSDTTCDGGNESCVTVNRSARAASDEPPRAARPWAPHNRIPYEPILDPPPRFPNQSQRVRLASPADYSTHPHLARPPEPSGPGQEAKDEVRAPAYQSHTVRARAERTTDSTSFMAVLPARQSGALRRTS